MLKRFFLVFATLLFCAWTHGTFTSPPATQRLHTGDGGYNIGFDLNQTSQTRVMWNDASNGFIQPGGTGLWRPAVTAATFAGAVCDGSPCLQPSLGVTGMSVTPANDNVIYMMYSPDLTDSHNYLFKSTDKGLTWLTMAGFPGITNGSNNHQIVLGANPVGQRIGVDPLNENIIYAGHTENGVYRSVISNAGVPCFELVADADTGVNLPGSSSSIATAGIAFDGTGTTLTGTCGGTPYSVTASSKVYLPVYGQGVWQSINGGTTFHAISGGLPTVTLPSVSTTASNTVIYITAMSFQTGSTPSVHDILPQGSGISAFTQRCQGAINGWYISGYYATASSPVSSQDIKVRFDATSQFQTVTYNVIDGADISSASTIFDGACNISASTPSKTVSGGTAMVFTTQVSNDASPTSGWTCNLTCGQVGRYWSVYKTVGAGTYNPAGVGTFNRGGISEAIKQSTTLAMETTKTKQATTYDIATTPTFIRNGKIACDGSYYVTTGIDPRAGEAVGRNGWKYNGTPFSWSKLIPYMGTQFNAAADTGGISSTTIHLSGIFPGGTAIPYVNGASVGASFPFSGILDPNTTIVQQLTGTPGLDGDYQITPAAVINIGSVIALAQYGEGIDYVIPVSSPPAPDCNRIWVGTDNRFTQYNQTLDAPTYGFTCVPTAYGVCPGWTGRYSAVISGSFVNSAAPTWYIPGPPAVDPNMHSLDGGDAVWNKTTQQFNGSTGYCFYTATIPTTNTFFNWQADCEGPEAAIPQFAFSIPGGNTFFAYLDIGMFANLSPTTWPTYGLPLVNPVGGLCGGKMVDYMGTDPTKVIYLCLEGSGLQFAGFGINGGLHQSDWTQFGITPQWYQVPTIPDRGGHYQGTIGGSMQVNACDRDNVMMVGTNNDVLWRTKNATSSGITWDSLQHTLAGLGAPDQLLDTATLITAGSGLTPGTYTSVPFVGGSGTGALGTFVVSAGGAVTSITVTNGGNHNYLNGDVFSASSANLGGSGTGPTFNGALNDTGWGNYLNAETTGARLLISDKVQCDTFYIYNFVTDKIYRTTDKGDTWAIAYSGVSALTSWTASIHFEAVSNVAGEFMSGNGGVVNVVGSHPIRYTGMNSGTGSAAVMSGFSSSLSPWDVSYGKEKPGNTNKTIYILANPSSGIGAGFGVYRSTDNGTTFTGPYTQLQPIGDEWPSFAIQMGADANTYGLFYTGQGAAGAGSGFTQVQTP